MVGWLKPVLVALAIMVALWALLVVLAARLPPGLLKDLAGFLPACVTLAPGCGSTLGGAVASGRSEAG